MNTWKWYNISADNGETWTTQLLTQEEAEEQKREGYIVTPDSRMTGCFARKPTSVKDLEWAGRNGRPERIRAVAEVSLTEAEWNDLLSFMTDSRDYIAAHTDKTGCDDGVMLCIIVTTPGDTRKIAVESEGYDYPRYAALVR